MMISEQKLRKLYFNWLMDKIDDRKYNWEDYNLLIRELYKTTFIWSEETPELAMDVNRAKDGVYLRCMFRQDTGLDIEGYFEEIGKDCSILEMMIALAIRIENEIMGYGTEEYGRWFWEMVKGLKLLKFDDFRFNEERVRDILRGFLRRDISMFSSVTSDRKMSSLEIWDQMGNWLNEKFGEKMGFL